MRVTGCKSEDYAGRQAKIRGRRERKSKRRLIAIAMLMLTLITLKGGI